MQFSAKWQPTPNAKAAFMAQDRQDSNLQDDLLNPAHTNADLADDKGFFDALEASVRSASAQRQGRTHLDLGKRTDSKLFRIQIILIAGTIAIASAFVWRFYKPGSVSQRPARRPHITQYYPEPVRTTTGPVSPQLPSEANQALSSPVPPEKPLSLQLAHELFIQGDYPGAFEAYERLDQALPQDSNQRFMHDFLKARMAVCLKLTNHTDQAEKLFRIVCASDSCTLAAMANYQRALIEFERRQYLEARTYAYRAMALCEAVTTDLDWTLTLKKDCHFLIALALSRRIVSLSETDADIPVRLWRTSQQASFGCDMTESDLEAFLASGNKKLTQALMGPKVTKLAVKDNIQHFEVVSNIAPAEELFARFAANTDMRLAWFIAEKSTELRRGPVTMFLPDATCEEFASIAAGCVGLQAVIDTNTKRPTIKITNPTDYTELSSHLAQISDEALELWQDFVIRYFEDKRLAEAHFASGLIYAAQAKTLDAIAQFKLVANRHGNSSLAPYALLHSSTIRADLHDYAGAKEDLKQLIEQYSQTTVAQRASLRLADAALKTELYNQAANTYCKVYNLDDTAESRIEASLGAAKAFFAAGDYPLAETWLAKYFNLATKYNRADLHNAYLLLGKTLLAQEKRPQAFDAFKLSLSGELTQKDRTDIIAALLECGLDKLDSIQALDILETLESQGLSATESTEALLLKCRILRKMYLAEKALAALNDRVDYILQPQLRAKAYFEAAACLVDTGQIETAHRYLVKSLALMAGGPLADQVTLRLAELSLRLDKDDQTIELCSQLLQREIPDELRRAAVAALATAYKKQNNYEKAVTLLLEQAEYHKDTAGDKTAAGNQSDPTSIKEELQQDG